MSGVGDKLGCGRGLGVKVGGNQTWVGVAATVGVSVSRTNIGAGVMMQALKTSKSAESKNVLIGRETSGGTKRNYSEQLIERCRVEYARLRKPMRILARSKIHKATVTDANVEYVGSITIDEDLVEKAGLWPGEKVLVVSNTTGERLETYVILGERGSGQIVMNGGAAHKIKKGEEVIIIAFEFTEQPVQPRFILVDDQNKFVRYL
jgi:aspartate 1-decarboxylase